MGDPVLDVDATVFQTKRAMAAFDKYAAVTHLTVRAYDRDERLLAGPAGSNRLFDLFARGREPAIVGECVKRALAELDGSAVVVEDGHGLALVGVPFTHSGEIIAVAVAGYALTTHLDQREMQ